MALNLHVFSQVFSRQVLLLVVVTLIITWTWILGALGIGILLRLPRFILSDSLISDPVRLLTRNVLALPPNLLVRLLFILEPEKIERS